jgi:hypothetical protein
MGVQALGKKQFAPPRWVDLGYDRAAGRNIPAIKRPEVDPVSGLPAYSQEPGQPSMGRLFASCIIKAMTLLWKPENWSLRLAELEARTGDIKEAPLRRDVRSLGMLARPGSARAGRRAAVRRGGTTAADRHPPREAQNDNPQNHEEKPKTRTSSLPRRWAAFTHWTWCRPTAWRGPLPSTSSSSTWPRPTIASAAGCHSNFPATRSAAPCAELCARCAAGISGEEAVDWLRRISYYPCLYRAPHRGGPARGHVQAAPHRRPAGAARSHPALRRATGTASKKASPPRLPRCGRPTKFAPGVPTVRDEVKWASTTTTPPSMPRCPVSTPKSRPPSRRSTASA